MEVTISPGSLNTAPGTVIYEVPHPPMVVDVPMMLKPPTLQPIKPSTAANNGQGQQGANDDVVFDNKSDEQWCGW